MYISHKNIKVTLFVIILFLIMAMLFMQYDVCNYINDKTYEYEKQIKLYQEQIDLYKENISLYEYDIKNIENELLNVKKELADVKSEISNAKEDILYLQEQTKNIISNNNNPPNTNGEELYVGRLYVPEANISVALYDGWAQEITDRSDSANYFSFIPYSVHKIIADHNNQEFSKLFNVKVGTTGYIEFKNGSIENIECIEVLSGYNISSDIVDKNGNSVSKKEDYLMYTCQNGWENIFICLWTVI